MGKSRRIVPAPAHPVRMPAYADADRIRDEFRFMLYGGVEPADKLWRQWSEDGRYCRRRGTRDSPLAFAYVYLTGAMKPMRTPSGPVFSFSEFHLALCEEAKHWINPNGRRTGVVGPRGIGKSFWEFFANPIWAIAHGHRNSFAGYSHSDKQAVGRMDDIRRELHNNELLQYDFPELALLKGERNHSHLVTVASGRSFSSNGIDAVTLGLRPGKYRPDIKVIDDGEPNAGNYHKEGSKGSKEDRLQTIRDIVLPMNSDAAVVLSGTVVMPGSIGDDLVRTALGEPLMEGTNWLKEEKFTNVIYLNAILDESTPRERSIWPERWSLEFLKQERRNNPAQYALHYANRPMTSKGQYWQAEEIQRHPHFPQDHFVMYVDPAEVAKPGRDKTAVIVVGVDATRDRAVVKSAFQGHLNDPELGQRIARYKLNHPEIPHLDVYVEGYNSGELRYRTLLQYTQGVHGLRLQMDRPRPEVAPTGERGKLARIAAAHAHYQRRRVWHESPFPELEALLTAYPKVRNDDLPDALAGALRKALRDPAARR